MANIFSSFTSIFTGPGIEVKNHIVTLTGSDVRELVVFTKKFYSAMKFLENICISIEGFASSPVIKFHEFFAMEIYTLYTMARAKGYCRDSRSTTTMQLLAENTWLKTTDMKVDGIFDDSVFGKIVNPKLRPLPVQYEFIRDVYYQKKMQYQLNGYLLSLPPGCGKSLTSLFLSAGLHKTHLIILCPLSLVNSVWVNEVENCFQGKKTIKTVTGADWDLRGVKCDTIVANYESISKLTDYVCKNFPADKTMIIVDECHNFKDIDSKRTQELIDLQDRFRCKDVLLMSGTPVKAFGKEALPILKLLDPYYNDEVGKGLKSVSRYSQLINELMCRRLGFIMFRKTKEEVFTLPPKHESDLKISIPNARKFTATSVKSIMEEYSNKRTAYYESLKPQMRDDFFRILNWYENRYVAPGGQSQLDYMQYLEDVNYLAGRDYHFTMAERAHRTRLYEDTNIIPTLSSVDKKTFKACRAVVKYVKLKVMGEVLGNVLGQLRIEMTSAMLADNKVKDIIKNAKKKTILFSSYTDTIKLAADKCKLWGFKPLVVDGSNSKQAREIADKFNRAKEFNPLIASLQVMSTGHTLNSANTVIFLNVPFRSVDYEQASDRCYRIGQDTEVYIYRLVLDTGNEPNLSTRMQDILAWSKKEFDTIMGDGELPDGVAGNESFSIMVDESPELQDLLREDPDTLGPAQEDFHIPLETYGFWDMSLTNTALLANNTCELNGEHVQLLNDGSIQLDSGEQRHAASLIYGSRH